MLKRKRVYICDHCGAVALEQTYFFMTDTWKDAPEGWTKLCAQSARKRTKGLKTK